MTIQEIEHGSPLYDECCALRERVLRVPLWMHLRPEDIAGEEVQIHLAAVETHRDPNPGIKMGELVGCVVLKPLGTEEIKLRQMAVSDTAQRRGIGSELVRRAVEIARERGFAMMSMDARESARGFYERLGFAAVGDRYEIIGLPHVRMEQSLARS